MLRNKRDSPDDWEQEPKAVPYARFTTARQTENTAKKGRTKACFYGRYSCDNQNAATIDSQRNAVIKYAEANGLEIVTEYIDEALSGKDDRRPAFRRMVSDAQEGLLFDVICIYKQDRLSRSMTDYLHYKALLEGCGVRIIAVEGSFDDETPEGWMGNSVNMVLNEFYIRNLKRETIRGLTESALNCKCTGGKPPLGYKWGPEPDRKMEIDEDGGRADSARKIFEWAAEGKTYKWIADQLNSMGRKNAYGRPFKDFFLDMLRNEKYRGVFTWRLGSPRDSRPHKRYRRKERDDGGAVRIEGGCPRLISDELFFKVQRQLQHKQRARPLLSRKYLLTGLLRCECGYALSGGCKPTGKKKSPYYFYICCSPRSSDNDYKCYNNGLSMSLLNEFVIETIRNFIHNPERVVRSINNALEADGKEQRVTFADVKKALSEFKQKVRKTTMDAWKEIVLLLVNEIHVSKEQVEMYLRLNVFFDYNSRDDLLCMFHKDRLSLRKIPFYTRKKSKENKNNENNNTTI